MGISYSKASSILILCEESLGLELLNRTAGGPFGGGSSITEDGERLMLSYEQFMSDVDLSIKQLYMEHFDHFD